MNNPAQNWPFLENALSAWKNIRCSSGYASLVYGRLQDARTTSVVVRRKIDSSSRRIMRTLV